MPLLALLPLLLLLLVLPPTDIVMFSVTSFAAVQFFVRISPLLVSLSLCLCVSFFCARIINSWRFCCWCCCWRSCCLGRCCCCQLFVCVISSKLCLMLWELDVERTSDDDLLQDEHPAASASGSSNNNNDNNTNNKNNNNKTLDNGEKLAKRNWKLRRRLLLVPLESCSQLLSLPTMATQ